ncbi:hypothetical protein pb186bvf_008556 [Paramecium bursaria]
MQIPKLRQNDSSFQRYRNPLNELIVKDSFERPNELLQLQMQPYEREDSPIRDVPNFASLIMEQKYSRRNQNTYGSKILCSIDIALVNRYFNQKLWIFQSCNQRYNLERSKISNADWLRNRIEHRYKLQYRDAFFEMIEEIMKIGEMQANVLKEPLQIPKIKVFQNLERQLQKPNKQEFPFDQFILDMQKKMIDFIFYQFE